MARKRPLLATAYAHRPNQPRAPTAPRPRSWPRKLGIILAAATVLAGIRNADAFMVLIGIAALAWPCRSQLRRLRQLGETTP